MKRFFPSFSTLLAVPVLAALLCGCNPDVFIDDFAPSAEDVQLATDGSDVVIDFKTSDWRVNGIWLRTDFTQSVDGGNYEALTGCIYSPDGTLIARDTELYCRDTDPVRLVVDHPRLALTVERTSGRQLHLYGAENISLDMMQMQLLVGDEYTSRTISLRLDPSPRYRVDSIVYSLDSWYEFQDNSIVRQAAVSPINGTDHPWSYPLHPYERFHRMVTFAGGDQWTTPIDVSLFQMFGTEMPVLPVPELDKYDRPRLMGTEFPLSGETYELPVSDELLAVTDTVVVPPGKIVDCIVKCSFRYTGIPYELHASCLQTGRRRVLKGRMDLYDPKDYSFSTTERDVNFGN